MSSPTPHSLSSPRLAEYFRDYAAYHRTKGNQVSHVFGISFIVISLLGLLSHWTSEMSLLNFSTYMRLDGGTWLIGIAGIWYTWTDWKIAGPFLFILMGLYFLGRALPIPLNWGLFVLGWILQGIGHYFFEKNSPAFFKSLTHLLVGPLWIFCKMIGYK